MERKGVYAAIDSERDYQDAMWGPVSEKQNQTAAWLTYMRVVLSRAENAAYKEVRVDVMEEVRKLGALCVACMEEHGCRKR